MKTYATLADNIGTMYTGNSKREAMRHARESREAWPDNKVTVTCDGEPVAESQAWIVELTDTFAGEANYSWVKRKLFTTWADASQRAIVREAKRALDLTGRWHADDSGHVIQLRARGACLVAFITPHGEE